MLSAFSAGRRFFVLATTIFTLVLPPSSVADPQPSANRLNETLHCSDDPHNQVKLESREVVVSSQDIDGVKYVVGKIWIDEEPEKVWPTLVNPFEYKANIYPRLKEVAVLVDNIEQSVMSCKIHLIFPLPDIHYVVESKYSYAQKIEFRRLKGNLRDFRGHWSLRGVKGGAATEVTYAMYVDPGIPVPDWVVRQGVRVELPSTLNNLRNRVEALKKPACTRAHKNITAARV